MMMLGREIGLPAELMFGSPRNTGQPEGDQYVGELQIAIEGAHRVARETLKQSRDALYPLGELVNHHQDVFISSLSAR
jgi:hypothetical protein